LFSFNCFALPSPSSLQEYVKPALHSFYKISLWPCSIHCSASFTMLFCISQFHLLLDGQGSFPKKRSVGTVGAKIEALKGVGVGRGFPPPYWGKGLGRVLCPLPRQNFRFWISNRRILVQTGCFLRSSPKAGLNAVLVRRKLNCQTLSICVPMNDLLLLLFGLRNCCCLCSRGSQV